MALKKLKQTYKAKNKKELYETLSQRLLFIFILNPVFFRLAKDEISRYEILLFSRSDEKKKIVNKI